MLSPAEAVDLAAGIYPVGGVDFDWIGPLGDAYVGIKRYPDGDAVVLRGSITGLDWLRDALSETPAAMAGFGALGVLPFGFRFGLPAVHALLTPRLRPAPVVFIGHSLGGAEAIHLAAMHVTSGGALAGVFGFEAPRAGTAALTKLLAPYPVFLTANGPDPVPHVPVPEAAWPWQQPRDLIRLDAAPAGHAAWDPFAWHHIALVRAGVKAMRSG